MGDIPKTLRTGFSAVDDADDTEYDDMSKKLISLVAVMTKRAGEVAYHLAVHDNRDTVTSEDVNAALKYQARTFLHTLDHPDVMDEASSMYKDLFDDIDDHDEDMHEDDHHERTSLVDNLRASMEVSSDGQCACETCDRVGHANATWNEWHPTDEAEQFLKRSVEKAMTNYMSRD